MEVVESADLAKMRAVVGYLGERNQSGWWQSSFFAPGSQAFLAPVFGRTRLLAQCTGVAQAAAVVHDERIGVGDVYHLFRLPEDIEQALHRALHSHELSADIRALHATNLGVKTRTFLLPPRQVPKVRMECNGWNVVCETGFWDMNR